MTETNISPTWAGFFRQSLKEAVKVCLSLFRIMIPIIIGVKLLQFFDLIQYLAMPLAPIMKLVGLPGSMGLAWAAAMLNNIYSGMVVFVSLAQAEPLNVGQVTVLCSMMLVAHNLPVELKIAQSSGTRLPFQFLVRFLGALLLGWILHQSYTLGGWLMESNEILWRPKPVAPTWTAWGIEQAKGLGMIFLIVLGLVLLMRILNRLGLTQILIRLLSPVLRLLGIGGEAATITIVGMTMGLAYGGGLIIHEAKSGKVGGQDVFCALTLMGLTHSLIEDTLLMMVLGAHLSGIFWGRLAFTLAAVFLLVKGLERLPQHLRHRFLYPTTSAEDQRA